MDQKRDTSGPFEGGSKGKSPEPEVECGDRLNIGHLSVEHPPDLNVDTFELEALSSPGSPLMNQPSPAVHQGSEVNEVGEAGNESTSPASPPVATAALQSKQGKKGMSSGKPDHEVGESGIDSMVSEEEDSSLTHLKEYAGLLESLKATMIPIKEVEKKAEHAIDLSQESCMAVDTIRDSPLTTDPGEGEPQFCQMEESDSSAVEPLALPLEANLIVGASSAHRNTLEAESRAKTPMLGQDECAASDEKDHRDSSDGESILEILNAGNTSTGEVVTPGRDKLGKNPLAPKEAGTSGGEADVSMISAHQSLSLSKASCSNALSSSIAETAEMMNVDPHLTKETENANSTDENDEALRTGIKNRLTSCMEKLPNNYVAGVMRVLCKGEDEGILPRIFSMLKTSTLRDMDAYLACVNKDYAKEKASGQPWDEKTRMQHQVRSSASDHNSGDVAGNLHAGGHSAQAMGQSRSDLSNISRAGVSSGGDLGNGLVTNGQNAPIPRSIDQNGRSSGILQDTAGTSGVDPTTSRAAPCMQFPFMASVTDGSNHSTSSANVSTAAIPAIARDPPPAQGPSIWRQPPSDITMKITRPTPFHVAFGDQMWHFTDLLDVSRPSGDYEAFLTHWSIAVQDGNGNVHHELLPRAWSASIWVTSVHGPPSLREFPIILPAEPGYTAYVLANHPDWPVSRAVREGIQPCFLKHNRALRLGNQEFPLSQLAAGGYNHHYRGEASTSSTNERRLMVNIWYLEDFAGGDQRVLTSSFNGVPLGTFHSRVLDQLLLDHRNPDVHPLLNLNLPGFEGSIVDLRMMTIVINRFGPIYQLKRKYVPAVQRSDFGFLPKVKEALQRAVLVPINSSNQDFIDNLVPLLRQSRCSDGSPIRVIQIYWVQNENLMDSFGKKFQETQRMFQAQAHSPALVTKKRLFIEVKVWQLGGICTWNLEPTNGHLGRGVYLESCFASCDGRAHELRSPDVASSRRLMMMALTVMDPAIIRGYSTLTPPKIWRDNIGASAAIGESSHGGKTYVMFDRNAIYPQYVIEYEPATLGMPAVNKGRYSDLLGY